MLEHEAFTKQQFTQKSTGFISELEIELFESNQRLDIYNVWCLWVKFV